MLTLLCGATALLALACSDRVPTEPRAPLAPSFDLAADQAPVPGGCARFEVRLLGRDRVEVTVADTASCGPVQPVLAGTPVFDHSRKTLRLPVALENRGERRLRAPARLYGWEDSLAVTAPAGLAKNWHAGEYLAFTAPDSLIADTAMALAGARVWRFDTLLAPQDSTQTLAAGKRSGVRWVELSVHAGVERFRVTLHAEARRASAPVPAVPPDTIPSDLYAAENLRQDPTVIAGEFLKNIVVVMFEREATPAQRSEAIALIDGEVIGGQRWGTGDGLYYVRIPGDDSAAPILHAVRVLEQLPYVGFASFEFTNVVSTVGLRPDDGSSFREWQRYPLLADRDNWGPEAAVTPP